MTNAPNILTCTPSELRDLMLKTGDAAAQYYLSVNDAGQVRVVEADGRRMAELIASKEAKFAYYMSVDQDMSMKELISDTVMAGRISQAQTFWHAGTRGLLS